MYAAPDPSTDLFHAIPPAIIDPFLYVEADGRRVALIGVLDATDKVARARDRDPRPGALGADELLSDGVDAPRRRASRSRCARCRELGIEPRVVPPGLPARGRRPRCAPAASS